MSDVQQKLFMTEGAPWGKRHLDENYQPQYLNVGDVISGEGLELVEYEKDSFGKSGKVRAIVPDAKDNPRSLSGTFLLVTKTGTWGIRPLDLLDLGPDKTIKPGAAFYSASCGSNREAQVYNQSDDLTLLIGNPEVVGTMPLQFGDFIPAETK